MPVAPGAEFREATGDAAFRAELLAVMRERRAGVLAGEGSAFLDSLGALADSRVLSAEQSS